LIFEENKDVSVVLSNPPILPFAAWLHKKVQNEPYVYVIYDMYPDMPVQLDVLDEDGLIARLWEYGIRYVYRDADRIVVLGESMRRRLERKMAGEDFDPEKIVVIPNWEDGEFIQPIEKSENAFARKHDTTEKFTLLYSGNIGRYHDVGTAIDGIAELERRGRDDIQLLVIGEGGRKEQFQRRVATLGTDNVHFLPFQPLSKLPETLTCADASLVAIDKSMKGICVSSKLYSSLAVGDPVLAVVADGDEVARVVDTYDCGSQAEPDNAEAVADILERWADNPQLVERLGENARRCFEQNYRREHAVEAYSDLLDSVVEC
jgi:glycosyltransferase involved in cell wall biosynthesis